MTENSHVDGGLDIVIDRPDAGNALFALAACFINVRAAKSIKKDRVPWHDWLLAGLSLAARDWCAARGLLA